MVKTCNLLNVGALLNTQTQAVKKIYMIYYFAYGSNLHPLRLKKRVPSAELVAVAKYPNHSLIFHKQSNDGSSKCNMFNSDVDSDLVYGAIYKIKPEHKNALDRFEGDGYIDNQIILKHDGNEYDCFAYLAQQTHLDDNLKPYHWYKELVVLGAQYLKFPGSYISSIKAVESMNDPDSSRRQEHEILIKSIINLH